MTLNGLQLTAMAKAGKAMILADGKVEASELIVLANELNNFGVKGDKTEKVLNDADNMEPALMLASLSSLNEPEKNMLPDFLLL